MNITLFLIGFVLGAALPVALFWPVIHARLIAIEQSLRNRIDAVEHAVRSSAPAPVVPPPATPTDTASRPLAG